MEKGRLHSQWNRRGLMRWNQGVGLWGPAASRSLPLGAHRPSHLDCGIIGWGSRPRRLSSREPFRPRCCWLLLAVVGGSSSGPRLSRNHKCAGREVMRRTLESACRGCSRCCLGAVGATPFELFGAMDPLAGSEIAHQRAHQRQRRRMESGLVGSGLVVVRGPGHGRHA